MLPMFIAILPTFADDLSEDHRSVLESLFNMDDDINIPLNTDTLSFLDGHCKWNNREDIESVARKIESFSNLRVLEFRGNTMGVQAGERVAEALKKHGELERALWSDMFTGRMKSEIPPILKSLCSAMMIANTRLTELDLSDNAFGPIGAEGIQDFLVSPSAYSLQTLKLNNNGLGGGGKVVARCLSECWENARKAGESFELKTFIAGRNRLEDPGACALSEAFKKIGTLEHIAVPQNGIRVKGVKALADAFAANKNLKIININDNTCTSEGGLAIAYVLEGGLENLEVLDLGDSLCRNDGGLAIIASIVGGCHPNLKLVDLSGNELSANCAFAAIEGWEEAGASATLKLGTNNFGSQFEDLLELRAKLNQECIDFGNASDDEGTLSDENSEEEESEDGESENNEIEEEEEIGEQENGITVLGKRDDEDVTDLLSGFGCMKMNVSAPSLSTTQHKNVSDADATLSFLDKQFKWNTREDVEAHASQIESFRPLRILELRGNTLGIESGERIADSLKKHPELERCLWSDLFTGRLKTEIPLILKSLCSAMMFANAQIIELDLSDNAFGPIGAEGIQNFLVSPSAYSLQILKLNNNGLGAGGKVIAASLLECHRRSIAAGRPLQLKMFVAGRNRLEVPGATALAEAFKAIGTLEEITLHQNGITAKGVAALADAFKLNRNLRVININDNTATEEGSRAIAEALPLLHKLEQLNLGDCLCRDAGCHAIVDALNPFTHQKLKEVILSGSEMTGAAALQIGPKFSKFMDRAKLQIDSNNFGGMFHEVKGSLPDCVSCGDSDDDQGSLSDDGEYQSEADSADDSDTEMGNENVPAEAILGSVCSTLERLSEEYESRSQEHIAKFVLQLCEVIAAHKDNKEVWKNAVDIAEDVVTRVEAAKRRPVPPSTQLINQLMSQAKFVKPETLLTDQPVDRDVLLRLLEELMKRGHFKKEEQTIRYFYKSSTPVSTVPKNPFKFSFNFGAN